MTRTVHWRPGVGLVDSCGRALTHAQAYKARRYVANDCIRLEGSTDTAAGYGVPYRVVDVYRLSPIPGCNQDRRVTVTTSFDATERVQARDFACDCQHARGTKTTDAGFCSHVLAVQTFLANKDPHS